jgi:hypothetical protein
MQRCLSRARDALLPPSPSTTASNSAPVQLPVARPPALLPQPARTLMSPSRLQHARAWPQELFDTLLAAVAHGGAKTVLRCAGGWVRDKLLGRDSDDIDIALDDCLGRDFAELVNDYLKAQVRGRHELSIDTQCTPRHSLRQLSPAGGTLVATQPAEAQLAHVPGRQMTHHLHPSVVRRSRHVRAAWLPGNDAPSEPNFPPPALSRAPGPRGPPRSGHPIQPRPEQAPGDGAHEDRRHVDRLGQSSIRDIRRRQPHPLHDLRHARAGPLAKGYC